MLCYKYRDTKNQMSETLLLMYIPNQIQFKFDEALKVTFENKIYPGYVTEKICDAYKSRCIPIYWGSNEVVNDFNPKTFINANDFSSFDELVEYIKKVDNDQELYESYFEESIFSKYPLIKEIKEELYQYGANYACMSGSGSAVFGLFENEPDLFHLTNFPHWIGKLK